MVLATRRRLGAMAIAIGGCGAVAATDERATLGNQVATPAVRTPHTLRDIDWRSRTYATTSADQRPLVCEVHDGVGASCPRLDGSTAEATIAAIAFGDLTGDRIDEAVVVLRLRPAAGAVNPADDYRLSAFTGRSDAPTLLDQIWVGPCAPGEVDIAGGWIDVPVVGTWLDCDLQNATRPPRATAPDDTDAFQRYWWDGAQLVDADGGRWQ